MEELQTGLDEIRRSPKDEGLLHMIVRRPQPATKTSMVIALYQHVKKSRRLVRVQGIVGIAAAKQSESLVVSYFVFFDASLTALGISPMMLDSEIARRPDQERGIWVPARVSPANRNSDLI